MRPPPALVTATGVGMLVAAFYPWLAERALAHFGARAFATALLAAGLVSLALWRRLGGAARLPLALHAALLALPALAALRADPTYLRLVPAAIQALIALFFARSLVGGSSILEQAAKRIHPYAPDFIGPYCRKATATFAAIFALQGAALAALALDPPAAGWALASGVLAWGPVLAASIVEWAVRKSWFRYYTDGPIDRRLRRWLPPESTAAGRRSLEYIRRMREQLGMPPP